MVIQILSHYPRLLMDAYEKAKHDLKEALALRRAQIHRTTVLDRDNQPLATGEALLEDGGSHGVFWPDPPAQADKLPSTPTNLCRLDGTCIAIADFHLCEELHWNSHYHFRIL
jgi:hypothetical protein